MSTNYSDFVVGEGDLEGRLDLFLKKKVLGFSRAQIQKLISQGNVSVNNKPSSKSDKLSRGDIVSICVLEKEISEPQPQEIPLDILYEDDEILVINKKAGMVVHPVKPSQKDTLVNALLWHTDKLSKINGPLRRGIVHRLDKETSGALLVAKKDMSHAVIVEQMKKRKIKRRYKALVLGRVEPEEGKIIAPLGRHEVIRQKMSIRYVGGREAVSCYKVAERLEFLQKHFTLLDVYLETGRTHQIRVHFASLGYPVAGDSKYGRKSPGIYIQRQALHAELIGFFHPASGKYMEFVAPLPDDMAEQLKFLTKCPPF